MYMLLFLNEEDEWTDIFLPIEMEHFLLGIKLIFSSKCPSPQSHGLPLISEVHSQNRALFYME